MSKFLFGLKKKKDKSTEDTENQLINDEKKKLKLMVNNMVEGLLKPYSPESIKRSIKAQIDKKRYLNPSEDQYKYSLLRNLIYFLEVEKEIKRTLANLINGDKFSSIPELDKHIVAIQSRVRHSIEDLLTVNHDKYYHKYLVTKEGINGLEREFIDHSLLHSWFIDACMYVQSVDKLDIHKDITRRWVVSEIERTFMWKLSEYLYLSSYNEKSDN